MKESRSNKQIEREKINLEVMDTIQNKIAINVPKKNKRMYPQNRNVHYKHKHSKN